MGVSCAAFIGWKHRAQARVTRAYYRRLALPLGAVHDSPRECPRETAGQSASSERSASCKARENNASGNAELINGTPRGVAIGVVNSCSVYYSTTIPSMAAIARSAARPSLRTAADSINSWIDQLHAAGVKASPFPSSPLDASATLSAWCEELEASVGAQQPKPKKGMDRPANAPKAVGNGDAKGGSDAKPPKKGLKGESIVTDIHGGLLEMRVVRNSASQQHRPRCPSPRQTQDPCACYLAELC